MSPSEPTPEVLAAIVAAVEMTWPRPVVIVPAPAETSPWKWSGRWWAGDRPVAANRLRP